MSNQPENMNHTTLEISTEKLLYRMAKMARKWRRHCGRAGGACCQQEEANRRADQARKECAKELETFIIEVSK